MKTVLHRFLSSMPRGATIMLLFFVVLFPIAAAAHYFGWFNLYGLFAVERGLVLKGQVWRLLTYAFLPNGIVDWVVGLFWLATLVGVLGRNWSGKELWTYCLLAVVTGGIFVLILPGIKFGVVGNGAMIFALLVAWYRLYGGERLILLGVGEISVRQAAVLIAVIEVLVLVFCLGPAVTAAMMWGGVVGWLYLFLRGKNALNRRSQQVDSERIARLEI